MSERPQLDTLPARDIVDLLLAEQARVVPAVQPAAASIAIAADLVAERLAAGGRLVFAGAGTSGRVAQAQAAELPGTFGLDDGVVLMCLAGAGSGSAGAGQDADEDDVEAAVGDAKAIGFTAADTLVAVAASGSTPYTLAVANAARAAGAAVVAVVNRPHSSLAQHATTSVELDTPPEVLRDSTRMHAGTAQKVALDALTTAAFARLGRVHADLMVDVAAANAKLRERAAGIVAEIAGVPVEAARRALDDCAGSARAAVVHLVSGLAPVAAVERAGRYRTLRDALSSLSDNEPDLARPPS